MTGRFGNFLKGLADLAKEPPKPQDAVKAAEEGMALLAAGDKPAAKPLLDEAIGHAGFPPAALDALVEMLLAEDDVVGAIAALEKAIAVTPDAERAPLWTRVGECHLMDGDAERGERCFRRALKLNADWTDAHIRLGVLCFEQGRRADAEASLMKAILLDRKAFEARQYMAIILMDREDWKAAAAQLHWIRKSDPGHVDAALLHATLFERQGDPASALAELEAVVAERTADARVYWRIARLHMAAKEREKALAAFLRCGEKDPTKIEAHIFAGRILEGLGRPDEALAAYQRALDAEPGQPDAAMYMAKILEVRQRWARAIELYDMATASEKWEAEAAAARDRLKDLLARMAEAMIGDDVAALGREAAPTDGPSPS